MRKRQLLLWPRSSEIRFWSVPTTLHFILPRTILLVKKKKKNHYFVFFSLMIPRDSTEAVKNKTSISGRTKAGDNSTVDNMTRVVASYQTLLWGLCTYKFFQWIQKPWILRYSISLPIQTQWDWIVCYVAQRISWTSEFTPWRPGFKAHCIIFTLWLSYQPGSYTPKGIPNITV